MTRPWGCPACGERDCRVRETGRDEDGYKVRLRVCTCGERWATEELPIAVSAFYPRARRDHERRYRESRGVRPCYICAETYQPGYFRQHVRFSKAHEAALIPVHGSRRNRRRISREWARRNREAA